MTKKHKKKTAYSGFTLMEMLVVIAIVGIIASVSLPVYNRLKPTINLSSTTRQITSDLREAQQMAVTEQNVYSVVFDVLSNTYDIVNQDSGETKKQVAISPQIDIESITNLTDDTISFNATGAALESGFITLANQKNSSSTIEIKPSGYVKISN